MNLNEQFLREIAQIKDPVYFLGLARTLNVTLVINDEPRPFSDLLADVLDKYNACGRPLKRDLLKMLKAANK